jgi:isoquinoline 1-oxidoreductase beta subunit
VPIKLMWTRNDDMRHGRFRPRTHHALRATWTAGVMLSWEHQVAAAEMDLRHGYGDALAPPGVFPWRTPKSNSWPSTARYRCRTSSA